jgi:hypothetical protein
VYIARGIRELATNQPGVQTVVHLRDRFGRGDVPDVEWIPALNSDGPWAVLSTDRFKKQAGAEREALRRGGHTVFLLERQWLVQTYWMQAERLVKWWPQTVKQAGMVTGSAFIVPWHHSSAAKFRGVLI